MSKRSQASSERMNWDKIFIALVQMLKTQQIQLETLVKERKIIEDRVRMQHDRWVADVRLYENQICQMKADFSVQDMERSLEGSKFDLLMGLKQREAFVFQTKLEQTDSELEDFKAFLDILCQKCSTSSDIPPRNLIETSRTTNGGNYSDEEERPYKVLECEVMRLRQTYEKLASEKSSEVSALLAEKKFVWNQYNILDNDYSGKLRSKRLEVEQANQKIEMLLGSLEELQCSNNEKDDTIATLKSQLAKMETDTSKMNGEISWISHELELLRKSTTSSDKPVLNRCTPEKNKRNDGSTNIIVKKESSFSQVPPHLKDSSKGDKSSKRKRLDVTSVSGTQLLFTSSFKVPKLKL